MSCLKSNAALFYAPLPKVQGNKPQKGRPGKQDGKVDGENPDDNRLPVAGQDSENRIRCGLVYVKCLKRTVKLVAVDYLKEDDTLLTRIRFCTDTDRNAEWISECYLR